MRNRVLLQKQNKLMSRFIARVSYEEPANKLSAFKGGT
jgi:hypothetical protein